MELDEHITINLLFYACLLTIRVRKAIYLLYLGSISISVTLSEFKHMLIIEH